jgi:hypothetical protein
MSDTVFILGAGFSWNAGIPLLGGFVEKMWELAVRGKSDKPLDPEDHQALKDAMVIRAELDSYHGRAQFDDRNIEDILSILSFNVLAGHRKDTQKFASMTNAIARTIEICCGVKHPGLDPRSGRVVKEGPELYRAFWKSLFSAVDKGHRLPTILTFNYDLVLERSLLQVLVGTEYGSKVHLPFEKIAVNYHYEPIKPQRYCVKYVKYDMWSAQPPTSTLGTVLEEIPYDSEGTFSVIDLIKLHGSLNFPFPTKRKTTLAMHWNMAAALAEPFILPPVFNKLSSDAASSMWSAALSRLRAAKNVVVVGYSLPQTDIYMQYFLKAALGPNLNLNKLVVFDPVLHTKSESCDQMKHRYESCFSPQLRGRIEFSPSTNPPSLLQGSAEAFVRTLETNPETLLF